MSAGVEAEQQDSASRPSGAGLAGWLVQDLKRARDLATIVAMLPDVVFKCEKRADGKIYWLLNEGKLAEEFGITTDRIKGKPLEELFPPPVVERILPHFERSFAGETHEFVNELGGRYFKHFPQPIFDSEGRVTAVVGFISEVTNLVLAEAEIRRLNEELEGRVRELEAANEQLSAYGYSVSHDLRGPLSVMRMSSRLLERHLESPGPKARVNLERLNRSIERMDQLIDDILSMARATRGELRRDTVDLSTQAAEAIAELRLRDNTHEVEVAIEPALTAIGDPRLLRIVLENLLSNAWKYSANVARPRIEFRAAPERGASTFLVRDNGAGFDMSQASRLFEAFERLHDASEFEGLGVGLATVRRIVVAHGGKLSVESAPGKGATFYFSLPKTP